MNNDLFSRLQYEPAILFIGDEIEDIDDEVVEYNWNMIMTTSVTSDVAIRFESESRTVTEIIDEDEMKANMLNPKDLHIVRLLGKNTDTLSLDEEEIGDLRYDAMRKMQRTVEISRKAGIIIVEHFDNDILDDKNIVRAFKKLIPHQYQLFVFNADDSIRKDFNKLVDDGIATLYSESINDYFDDYGFTEKRPEVGTNNNYLQFYVDAQDSGEIKLLEKKETIETDNFAVVLNISLLDRVKVRPNMYEDYFYSFLRNSVKEPQWYGYKYGFNVHRQFEDQLYKMTIDGLEHIGENRAKPLLLKGQTGSGKSIALAALGYRIFWERKYPVVFINNPDVNFFGDNKRAFRALDLLLQRIEELGASSILLIWDSSCFSINKKVVSNLFANLKARGRKVLLVASAYDDQCSNDSDETLLLETDILLKQFNECRASIEVQNEKEQLVNILTEKCGLNYRDIYDILSYDVGEYNFLTLFYQMFFTLRKGLAQGVKREADFNVDAIDKELAKDEKRLKDKTEEKKNREAFSRSFANLFRSAEEELIKAGFNISNIELETENNREIQTNVNNFVRCIAICSRFKLEMPYDMALRILGTNNHELLRVLLASSFFVLRKDQYSNYRISFRTSLEANMYLSANNIRYSEQIDYVIIILNNLNNSESYGQNSEVLLCEKLVRTIGPNDIHKNAYKIGYDKIIDALGELRENECIVEPKLIEQEITYIREYYGKGDFDKDTRIKWLNRAINISKDLLDDPVLLQGMEGDRNTLIVETANSKLLLYDLQEITDDYSYRLLEKDLESVIAHDSQNYYAYVTLFKTYISEYEEAEDAEKKTELLEAMLAWKEQLDIENNDVVNSEYFREQYARVNLLLGDTHLVQKSIDEMVSKGSAAGLYIYSKKELTDAGVDFRQGIRNSKQYEACNTVYNFLQNTKYAEVVEESESCQFMLLNLIWLINNGNPIFQRGEKWLTSISNNAWEELLAICNNYLLRFIVSSSETNRVERNIQYIKALSLAQLGEYTESIRTLAMIGEDPTIGSRRTHTMHIISDEYGYPRKFHGIIDVYDPTPNQKSGKIRIDEFGDYPIYFYGPHLETARLETGSRFDDIEIGLGYMGMKAFRKIKKS